MITALILFTLIVLVPYLLFFQKRYKDSNDKNRFLKENLFQSTLWIILLIVLPIIIINVFFGKGETNKTDIVVEYSLEELTADRVNHIEDIDFHYRYINKFQEDVHSISLETDFRNYYNEIILKGHEDIGNWAIGYNFLKNNLPDSALYYLNQVKDTGLKYRNLTLARVYSMMHEDSLVTRSLLKEAALDYGARNEALPWLVEILSGNEDPELLHQLLGISGSENYLNYSLTRKILLLNLEPLDYGKVIFRWFSRNINITGILAAVLILVVWSTYLIKLSFFETINPGLLAVSLILGMMFSFMTFLLSDILHFVLGIWGEFYTSWDLFLYSVFGIGAVEELVKIIPLLIILLISTKKLQPYEYILLASFSALGFAFIENLIYFDGNYGTIIHGRALTAAVGHMIDSSILAYGLVVARFKYKNLHPVAAFFLFWFLASLVHGLYDFWLFEKLILFFVLYFLLITRVWITIVNNSINNSSNFEFNSRFQTSPIQFYLAFSLTAILMFEYSVVGFTEGAGPANESLVTAAFSGSFMIMFLGSKLSSLNLIKNYWGKINYSINPFTDDIVSQNFIGEKVELSSYYLDRGLIDYFPEGVKGTIIKRVVLQNRPSTFLISYDDSEWFLVKLASPLGAEGFLKDRVLIKFKEAYSSLNAKKQFMVHFLMIPEKLPAPKMMRKNFHSLGWVFLKSIPTRKKTGHFQESRTLSS